MLYGLTFLLGLGIGVIANAIAVEAMELLQIYREERR